jgi:hypothetical protein
LQSGDFSRQTSATTADFPSDIGSPEDFFLETDVSR